ncbi:MAG: hypothetical protein QM820_38400 [Minicystis sp.]
MRNVLLAACAGGSLLLATACGGGGGEGGSGGKGNGGSSATGTSVLSCPDSLANAPNSEFCADEKTTPNCDFIGPNYHNQVCGVAVLDPTAALARSTDVKEYAGSGPPDVACFNPASYPKGGASQTVTLEGVAKIFSHGCESKDVKIEIYEVVDADIGTTPIGTPVTTASDCTVDGVASTNEDCGTRYECKYTYAGVPTEKELLVLTKGTLWAPLYSYNLYIPNAEVQNGKYTHDVRALATDDYTVIPQAAIGGPITPGNGAIAGEVHDLRRRAAHRRDRGRGRVEADRHVLHEQRGEAAPRPGRAEHQHPRPLRCARRGAGQGQRGRARPGRRQGDDHRLPPREGVPRRGHVDHVPRRASVPGLAVTPSLPAVRPAPESRSARFASLRLPRRRAPAPTPVVYFGPISSPARSRLSRTFIARLRRGFSPAGAPALHDAVQRGRAPRAARSKRCHRRRARRAKRRSRRRPSRSS